MLRTLRIDYVYRNLHHPIMKTTLNIKDSLLADAKALAAQQQTSLTRLIEEGLQLRLRIPRSDSKKKTQNSRFTFTKGEAVLLPV